jgi:hypothetical protein
MQQGDRITPLYVKIVKGVKMSKHVVIVTICTRFQNFRVEAGSNTSTVALLVVGGD